MAEGPVLCQHAEDAAERKAEEAEHRALPPVREHIAADPRLHLPVQDYAHRSDSERDLSAVEGIPEESPRLRIDIADHPAEGPSGGGLQKAQPIAGIYEEHRTPDPIYKMRIAKHDSPSS